MTAPCTRTSVFAIVWMIACVHAASAQALWEPPRLSDGPQAPPVAVQSDLVATLSIGNRGIELDKTPLSEVARGIGARTGQRGDASEALSWICMTGRDNGGRWVLWLESGEIHGQAIGAFQIRRIADAQPIDSRCVVSREDVRNPAGLRLGMSRADVRRILGESSGTPAMIAYLYEHPGADGFTIESMISVVFVEDAVAAFEVWRTETR